MVGLSTFLFILIITTHTFTVEQSAREKSDVRQAVDQPSDHEQSCQANVDSPLSAVAKEIEEAESRIKEAKKLLEEVTAQQQMEKQHDAGSKSNEEEKIQFMKQLLDKQDICIWNQFVRVKQLKQQCKEQEQLQEESQQTNMELERRVEAAEQLKEDSQQTNMDLERRVEAAEHLQEDSQQTNIELERRVEIAEQRVTELETQWVVNREEIDMTDRELGVGAWGVVKVAMFRGTEVAAKMMHQQIQSDYYRDLFVREINNAARLRHPNLTQFIGATIEGDMIILTELLHTSLRKSLEQSGSISREQIIGVSLDVCKALNYLHLMRPEPLVHRDVSSANVLFEKLSESLWKAKLADYGTVNYLCRLETEVPGNITYAAPEAVFPSQQSPKMDVFSFGILLIEMCTGKFPEVDARNRLISQIKDRSFVKLLRKCIIHNKDKRPEITEVLFDLSRF